MYVITGTYRENYEQRFIVFGIAETMDEAREIYAKAEENYGYFCFDLEINLIGKGYNPIEVNKPSFLWNSKGTPIFLFLGFLFLILLYLNVFNVNLITYFNF